MATEPLLKESWERKAVGETKGETPDEHGISLFFDLKEAAERSNDLRTLTDELERKIISYADAVSRYFSAKQSTDREAIQRADEHRHVLHEDLIATLNQLSRLYHKLGKSNSWRKEIGLDRDQVEAWALSVARNVKGKHN